MTLCDGDHDGDVTVNMTIKLPCNSLIMNDKNEILFYRHQWHGEPSYRKKKGEKKQERALPHDSKDTDGEKEKRRSIYIDTFNSLHRHVYRHFTVTVTKK